MTREELDGQLDAVMAEIPTLNRDAVKLAFRMAVIFSKANPTAKVTHAPMQVLPNPALKPLYLVELQSEFPLWQIYYREANDILDFVKTEKLGGGS